MRWIREYKIIAGLLALLLVLILIFLLSLGDRQNNSVTGSINKAMSYVSGPFTAATRTVRDTVSGIFSYKSLQAQVEELTAEKEELERELAQSALKKSELEELRELSGLLNYDYTEEDFQVVTADITSFDGSNWTNIFTIDKGTEAGIEAGDVVINGDGLIGKISQAGDGWAQVVSIIDDGAKVSFMVARDRKLLGVVEGNQQAQIAGYMLKGNATAAEGDIIITSGMGTYPAGLEIGTIKTITYNSDTLLKEITVEPAADFRSLKKGFGDFMKYWQVGLLYLAAFLIQPSLLNVINIGGYTPNLILCLTILSTFLYEEEIYGVIFGAVFGILYDIMYSNVVGPMPISLILVALGIIIVREYTNIENIINMWAVSIVSILAFYFLNWGLHHIAGNPVGFRFVFNSVPWIALYSLAVITILYWILIRKLARHRRDRYIR